MSFESFGDLIFQAGFDFYDPNYLEERNEHSRFCIPTLAHANEDSYTIKSVFPVDDAYYARHYYINGEYSMSISLLTAIDSVQGHIASIELADSNIISNSIINDLIKQGMDAPNEDIVFNPRSKLSYVLPEDIDKCAAEIIFKYERLNLFVKSISFTIPKDIAAKQFLVYDKMMKNIFH